MAWHRYKAYDCMNGEEALKGEGTIRVITAHTVADAMRRKIGLRFAQGTVRLIARSMFIWDMCDRIDERIYARLIIDEKPMEDKRSKFNG